MDPFNGGELSPGPAVETDEQILDWVGGQGETALHPSCTCRMGVDDLSVVDPLTMRVHGLDGLRVVDASAMPYVTNGNIYAPVMMLAEKAADLILGNTPLEPEKVDFYRHGVGVADAGFLHVAQLAAELLDLVAQPGRVLEPEVFRGLVHLVLEARGSGARAPRAAAPPPSSASAGACPARGAARVAGHRQQDVGDLLADRLRVDPVLPVVVLLDPAAALGLGDGASSSSRSPCPRT